MSQPIKDFEKVGFFKVPEHPRKAEAFLRYSQECPTTPEDIKKSILKVGEERIKKYILNPDKDFSEYILSLPEENFNDYRWGMMRQIWITHFIDEIDFYDWVLREIEEAKKTLNIE